MKILITGNVYFPLLESGALGGIERYATDMFRLLPKIIPNCETYLLASSDSTIQHDNFISAIAKSKEAIAAEGGSRYSAGEICASVRNLALTKEFDLVIDNYTNLTVNKCIAESFKCPIIHMCHVIMYFRNSFDYHKGLEEIKTKHGQYKMIAVSEYTKNNINGAIPGLIDEVLSPNYTRFEHRYISKIDRLMYCTYVGRVAQDKHIDFLCRVYDGWTEAGQFIIIGPNQQNGAAVGWYDQRVKPIIDRNPHIEIIGPRFGDDLIDLVRYGEANLNANGDEAYPLALFEAQKLGVPAITLKGGMPHGAQEFIIDDVSGFSIETYRKRDTTNIMNYRKAILQSRRLSHSTIWDMFNTLYSPAKYVAQLMEIASA